MTVEGVGRPPSNNLILVKNAASSLGRQVGTSIGRSVGNALIRGILGGLTRK